MLYPVNRATAEVLDRMAAAPRVGDIEFEWTGGWHESADRSRGFFESSSAVPVRWEDVILQGPHLTVGTPIVKEANETMLSNRDYSAVDLENIAEDFIPRTNYQVAGSYSEYLAAYPKWDGEPSSARFRLAWRRMGQAANSRTLHSAIVPRGHALWAPYCRPLCRRLPISQWLAACGAHCQQTFLSKRLGCRS